jgi:hypothetical protein
VYRQYHSWLHLKYDALASAIFYGKEWYFLLLKCIIAKYNALGYCNKVCFLSKIGPAKSFLHLRAKFFSTKVTTPLILYLFKVRVGDGKFYLS